MNAKRVYGDSIVGIWSLPCGKTIYPRELKERALEFEWRDNGKGYELPFLNGVALEYDEEA